MRHLLLFITWIFIGLTGFSQRKVTEILNNDFKVTVTSFQYDLENSERSTNIIKLPFSRVSCKDVRFDTTFIAINWQSSTTSIGLGNYNQKYTLYGGMARSLDSYINYYYYNNFSEGHAEILCYIKKFAFSLKDTSEAAFNPFKKINNINLEIDAYYKKDSTLFPAFRIDTVYTYEADNIKKNFSRIIKEIITPLIQKIGIVDTTKALKRKFYTQQQITDRYQSRFDIPILQETCKKGIYRNFEEFKNNSPSITDYKIKILKRKIHLYDTSDNIISTLDVFCFSDGKICQIVWGSSYSPLIRVGNSFEFEFSISSSYSGYYKNYIFLFPLNMETGKID